MEDQQLRPAGTKYGVLRRRNAEKKDIQRKAKGILSRLFLTRRRSNDVG